MNPQVLGAFSITVIVAVVLTVVAGLLRRSRLRALQLARRQVHELAGRPGHPDWFRQPIPVIAMLCGGAARVLSVDLLHLYRDGGITLAAHGEVHTVHPERAANNFQLSLLLAAQALTQGSRAPVIADREPLRMHFRQLTDHLRALGWARAHPRPLSTAVGAWVWLHRLLLVVFLLGLFGLVVVVGVVIAEVTGWEGWAVVALLVALAVPAVLIFRRVTREKITGIARSRTTVAGRAARLNLQQAVSRHDPGLARLHPRDRELFLLATGGSTAVVLDPPFRQFLTDLLPLLPGGPAPDRSSDGGGSVHHESDEASAANDTVDGPDSSWSDGAGDSGSGFFSVDGDGGDGGGD